MADTVSAAPGSVVRTGRRNALVLTVPSATTEVMVAAANGIEMWQLADLRPSTATATATGYAVRALEAAKAAETAATTALADYQALFDKRKAKIQAVAHREGQSHGIGSNLDDLLRSNGLEPRPTLFVRYVAILARMTYNGMEASPANTGPLNIDRYSPSGRFIPRVVVERVLLVDMVSAKLSFDRLGDCTCDTGTDRPSRDEVVDRMNRSFRWTGWTTELLDHKVAYVSGQNYCTHQGRFADGGRRITDLFPDAAPLTLGGGDMGVAAVVVGDLVEVTSDHWGMQVGWQFTVTRSGDEPGTVYGRSPAHLANDEWHIREFRRVNIRAGDVVMVVSRTLGLAPGTRLRVVQAPYPTARGPRLGGTRVDRDDPHVFMAHVDRVRLDTGLAEDEEDAEPFSDEPF